MIYMHQFPLAHKDQSSIIYQFIFQTIYFKYIIQMQRNLIMYRYILR